MRSWKTTLFGILAAGAGSAAQALPKHAAWLNTLASIFAGLGLAFARDNKVTSEEAGAVPTDINKP